MPLNTIEILVNKLMSVEQVQVQTPRDLMCATPKCLFLSSTLKVYMYRFVSWLDRRPFFQRSLLGDVLRWGKHYTWPLSTLSVKLDKATRSLAASGESSLGLLDFEMQKDPSDDDQNA
eukprot:COSAG01_NODE_4946_length_4600_cov_9.134192_9_plen_118_part_00